MAEANVFEDLQEIDANSNAIGSLSKEPENITDDELQLAKGKIDFLPENVKKKARELEAGYKEGDLTEKGYTKKLKMLIAPHLQKIQAMKAENEEQLYEPNVSSLPKVVIEQLEEIEREFEEEEITVKGYKRKREKLLLPFMLKEPPFESLPMSVQNELKEISKEFEEGDITEKGYRKRRKNILTPHLIKANTWSSLVSALPGKNNVVTVFVPGQEKPRKQSDKPVGIQIITGNEKLFKCQLCNEVFKQAQSFSGHCRLHRSAKSKTFKCTICKAAYTTRSHLKFHMHKHTGNYPYNCEFCGKGFAGKSQYRYHALRHSGQCPFICKECGGRFWRKRNLEVQCTKHRCDDAPPGFQRCAHCLAMFEELEELQSHMFEHDDEVELTAKNGRATMVQKNRIKAEVLKPVSVDETMESEEFEVEEEQEEFDDSVEGENYTVLSTEIVEVSAMLEQN